MSKDLILEEAIEQINEWRKSKESARGRIPEYCWRHAIRLSEEHGAKKVAHQMGFKLSDLESKIQNFNSPLKHTKKLNLNLRSSKKKLKEKDPFMEVPKFSIYDESFKSDLSQHQSPQQALGKCILELDLTHGMKLRIFQ